MATLDPYEIAVRAYTECPAKEEKKRKRGTQNPKNDHPSDWRLILDCETTADHVQALRFGFYQIRKSWSLHTEGIFYEPSEFDAPEIDLIEDYAKERSLAILTAHEFRRDVLLAYGYDYRATIIGFNLPFDLSRIAIGHGPARNSMRGGFSFKYTKDRTRPNIRVKHLSRSAALIDFAPPWEQRSPRSYRKKNKKVDRRAGFFVDVKTIASALLTFRGGLAALCDRLETQTRKHETEEHGGPLTTEYLDYARADVQATWECFNALAAQYESHGLSKGLHRILSEASLGKAYLSELGVKSFREKQPDFPKELFGQIMSAYYGGRAEVRIRKEPRRVLYCDFKSMYPTVNALMNLWSFVIAEEITTSDATKEIQTFLETVSLEDLKSPSIWKQLTVLVQLKPDGDLFPVRAKYDNRSYTIGLNYLTSDSPQWFTLADCIAAKVLTGKTPKIIQAIQFHARGVQSGLNPINLFGDAAFRVDPALEDIFRRFIDLRDKAKAEGNDIEQAIKILANATSYGIYIEIQRDDAPEGKLEPIAIWGPSGNCIERQSKALEQPGNSFNPLLGVLITGAARLMLAVAEQLTLDAGLEWVFCDTDSLAIARPKGMAEKEFLKRSQTVIDWFEGLNPYERQGSILEIESINYAD